MLESSFGFKVEWQSDGWKQLTVANRPFARARQWLVVDLRNEGEVGGR